MVLLDGSDSLAAELTVAVLVIEVAPPRSGSIEPLISNETEEPAAIVPELAGQRPGRADGDTRAGIGVGEIVERRRQLVGHDHVGGADRAVVGDRDRYTISSPALGWAGVTVLLISRSVAQSLKRKLAMTLWRTVVA